MRAIPPLLALAFVAACGEPEPPPAEPHIPALPVETAPLAAGRTLLVSDGDTLRLAVLPPEDGRQRVVRAVSGDASDSTSVLMDAATKQPIESWRVASTGAADSFTARIEYGRGFEGQARLTLGSGAGSAEENLRTPAPSLDAGQLPMVLTALRFDEADSVHFNYVAPFEKQALAARLLVGPVETLRIEGSETRARPVLLQVSGLEERYWFAGDPPHALLRLEELTRGRTWTRVEPPAP